VPKAVHVAVFMNPANASVTEKTLREVQEAAPSLGLQVQVLNATTIGEIEAGFAGLSRERQDALFVGGDQFFTSRAVQFVTLAAVNKIPATFSNRDFVAAGGLMSYGTNLADAFYQIGIYTGGILKGPKTGRHAGTAINQIRVCHQSGDGACAGHRGTAGCALDRR
jgi:putative ABC transport system substrate-binding protein